MGHGSDVITPLFFGVRHHSAVWPERLLRLRPAPQRRAGRCTGPCQVPGYGGHLARRVSRSGPCVRNQCPQDLARVQAMTPATRMLTSRCGSCRTSCRIRPNPAGCDDGGPAPR